MLERVSDVECGRVRVKISWRDAKPLKRIHPQPPAPYKYLIRISTEHMNRWLEAGDRIPSGVLNPPY